ncbi:hypothetical protein HDU93_002224 [Gonapodya sp. JEL0774]|nr:hypothetical protein HDU93_002224 [Gonapodya sp. JEL0774]
MHLPSHHVSTIPEHHPESPSRFEEALMVYASSADDLETHIAGKDTNIDPDGDIEAEFARALIADLSDRQKSSQAPPTRGVSRASTAKGRASIDDTTLRSCRVCGSGLPNMARRSPSKSKMRSSSRSGSKLDKREENPGVCARCLHHHHLVPIGVPKSGQASHAKRGRAPHSSHRFHAEQAEIRGGRSRVQKPALNSVQAVPRRHSPPPPSNRLTDFLSHLTPYDALYSNGPPSWEHLLQGDKPTSDKGTETEQEPPPTEVTAPDQRKRDISDVMHVRSSSDLAKKMKRAELVKAALKMSKTLQSLAEDSHSRESGSMRDVGAGIPPLQQPNSSAARETDNERRNENSGSGDATHFGTLDPENGSEGRPVRTSLPNRVSPPGSPTHPAAVFAKVASPDQSLSFRPAEAVQEIADLRRRITELEREKWERKRREDDEARIKDDEKEHIARASVSSVPDPFPSIKLRLAAQQHLERLTTECGSTREQVALLEQEVQRLRAKNDTLDMAADTVDARFKEEARRETIRTVDSIITRLRITRVGVPSVLREWESESNLEQGVSSGKFDKDTCAGIWTGAIDLLDSMRVVLDGVLGAKSQAVDDISNALDRITASADLFDRSASSCLDQMSRLTAHQLVIQEENTGLRSDLAATMEEVDQMRDDTRVLVLYAKELEDRLAMLEGLEKLERERRWSDDSGTGESDERDKPPKEGQGPMGAIDRALRRSNRTRSNSRTRTRTRTRTASAQGLGSKQRGLSLSMLSVGRSRSVPRIIPSNQEMDNEGLGNDASRRRQKHVEGHLDVELTGLAAFRNKLDEMAEENQKLKQHAQYLERTVENWKLENSRLRDLVAHSVPVPAAQPSGDSQVREEMIARWKERCHDLEQKLREAQKDRLTENRFQSRARVGKSLSSSRSDSVISGDLIVEEEILANEGKSSHTPNKTRMRTRISKTDEAVATISQKLDRALSRKNEEATAGVLKRVDDLVSVVRQTDETRAKVDALKGVVEDYLNKTRALESENEELIARLVKYRQKSKHSESIWLKRFEDVQKELFISKDILKDYEAAWRALEGVVANGIVRAPGVDDMGDVWKNLNSQIVSRTMAGSTAPVNGAASPPATHPLPFQLLITHVINLHASSAHTLARLRSKHDDVLAAHATTKQQLDHLIREFNESEKERRATVEMVDKERKKNEELDRKRKEAEAKLGKFVRAYGAVYGGSQE